MNSSPKRVVAFLSATALLAPGAARADVHQAQDIVCGNGTVGPFPLSWKHALYGSEAVILDGMTLHWGADYAFDPEAGTITFTHPLPSAEDVTVRYGYDTATAQAQGGSLTVPLSLALDQHLSVEGQFAAPTGVAPSPGSLNVGLSGGWQNAHGGRLMTRLLFLPALTGQDTQAAPNGMARLGLAVDGQVGLGRMVSLGFGASRAGGGVGSAGGTDWTAGQQKFNLSGVFTPSTAMQAAIGYVQTDPTTAGESPTQTLTASATLKPAGKGELDAAFTDTSSPARALAGQNLDIKAAITPGPRVSLSAESDQGTTGRGGVTQTLHANAVLEPIRQAQLGAAFTSTDAPGQSDSQTLSLQAVLTPNKTMQLSTDVALNQSAATDTQATTVNGAAQPNRFVQVSGGYTWRSATASQDAATICDSSAARVTLAPLSTVKLVGSYDQNPSDGSGNVQLQADHGLDLQTDWGSLILTGGYTWSRQYAAADTATSLDVGVGLRFSADTQLTGDYKHCLTDGATAGGTDAYTLGLTRNLGDAFNLSLNGSMQQPVGAAAAAPSTLTASASLGMRF